MKALILAAGLGTRLRPVTDAVPKALVVVRGKTLLEQAIVHLKSNGIRQIIINLHHFPGQIKHFLDMNDHFGLDIYFSDETDELLETGGGLKKAAWFFGDDEPFLVRNVDVISDLDLGMLEARHRSGNALATLVVRERTTARYFLFDDKMQLSGWENRSTGERKLTRESAGLRALAFSGIQVLNPSVFPLITEKGRFSLTGLYLRLSAVHPIVGFPDNDSYWEDAGKKTGEPSSASDPDK